MATDLKQFSQSLKDASPRTRWVAIGGALLMAAILGLAGVISSRPHFVLLHGQVSDTERVAVEKSLAAAGIRYRISQPPGPFVVDVDESQFYEAQNAVAIAGALQRSSTGIDTGSSGSSKIFMTAAERAQAMQKREWQELEQQLACLDFVASARVTTAIAKSSPLREDKPVTVSVTLALRGQTLLTAEQAANVGRIVRYRFNVPPENVVITDQNARTLYAGNAEGDSGVAQAVSRSEHARSYERALEEKANDALARAYGAGKGYVTLATEWDYDLRTIDDEVLQPKGVLIDDEKTETVTPPNAPSAEVGGAAGTASNLTSEQEPLTPEAAAAVAAANAPATSTDSKRRYDVGRTRTRTVHSTPTLERMSVSLVLDQSLEAKKDEIAQLVEAIVGFEPTRKDVLRVSTTAIVQPEAAVDGEPVAATGGEGMSPTLRMVLGHGVELLAAIAFLVVAFKTLKGAKLGGGVASGGMTAAASTGGAGAVMRHGGGHVDHDESEPDPEMLARARVEELVRTDPRRVGEILSRWATETTKAAG